MKKTVFTLITLFIASVFSAFSQQKERLPYELQDSAEVCDTIYTLPDEKVQFPGGTSELMYFFKDNSKFSNEMVNIGGSRRLTLKLLVDNLGKVIRTDIRTPLSPELDEDAMNIVAKFPELTPAKVKGRAVCSYLVIPLQYK
ncbi:MAG: energy transducer TonB [Prevotellaceae bacterium]|jgi:hypothetical protein|nr:energy transducer TonB [Prevotellaceae bacterium]